MISIHVYNTKDSFPAMMYFLSVIIPYKTSTHFEKVTDHSSRALSCQVDPFTSTSHFCGKIAIVVFLFFYVKYFPQHNQKTDFLTNPQFL